MKFTEAWADVAQKNTIFKIVIAALSLCCLVFAITTTRLALRDPLVIERGCFTKIANKGSQDRAASEVDAFLSEAISRRFNTGSVPSGVFLSPEEELGRRKDQETLAGQGMSQRVLLNSAKVDGNQVSLDCDRIISVGAVRSAFTFPLKATIATVNRTEANPYGLVLMNILGPDSGKKEKRK
jgi:hypothetical protein